MILSIKENLHIQRIILVLNFTQKSLNLSLVMYVHSLNYKEKHTKKNLQGIFPPFLFKPGNTVQYMPMCNAESKRDQRKVHIKKRQLCFVGLSYL